jgi:hypothetical protein
VPTDNFPQHLYNEGLPTKGGLYIATITYITKVIILSAIVIFLTSIAICALGGNAVAQKDSVPKPQDTVALGQNEAEQLLLLIDSDKTGKITKQEWMKFMAEEFDRLDKNKSGEIDAKELARSRLRARPFANVGK